ncbi:MAG: hypothetical protein CMG26_00345 [Candidatus Marinimicrobia bacterium]|nr:hypothetical protein [Candidatus Neomarinimicrobiota bacterium]
MKNLMFEPIIERLLSYQRLFANNSKSIIEYIQNFLKNFNQYLNLYFNKIRYKIEFKHECYLLGQYLGNVDSKKYDLSHDKEFLSMIEKIKFTKEQISRNEIEISKLSNMKL